MESKTMTVRDLRAWLAANPDLDDSMEVVVRVSDDAEAIVLVGGLTSLGPDAGCTDVVVLMLDAHTDAEPED